MRRVGIFLLAVIALVAMAGPVSAQPKVTITGFVDNITSWDKNMSVADINPAAGAGSFPDDLTIVNHTIYFEADDGVHGEEVWRSAGTFVGTSLMADLAPSGGLRRRRVAPRRGSA